MSAEPNLTSVTLRREKGVRRDRLRFGAPLKRRRIAPGAVRCWFAPNAHFCVVRWRRNAYGTISWRLFVARSGAAGEAMTRLPGVAPGAHPLAVFRGADRVRRTLKVLARMERQGVRLAQMTPAYWRRFQERVFQNRNVAPPDRGQRRCAEMRAIACKRDA